MAKCFVGVFLKAFLGACGRVAEEEVGSCGGVYMDALAGKWTCELECMTGFVKTAGGVISCGPNADEP